MPTLQSRIATYLNDYLFSTVWNQPQREFRRVIVPAVLSQRSVQGTWDYQHGTVTLPTTAHYYVCAVTRAQITGIPITRVSTWQSLSTIMNNDRLDIRVHGNYGQMLYRDAIYVAWHAQGDNLLVAIDKNMAKKILGDTPLASPFFMEIYYDTDAVADMKTWHYHLTSESVRQQAFADATHITVTKELVFVNGRVVDVTQITQLAIGDYIECVDDGNVLTHQENTQTIPAIFTVDPFDGVDRIYVSSVIPGPAYIIHIPKSLNPEYYVLTHNTCDVYAMPVDGSPGLPIHRAYSNLRGFIQLTHADFAIPLITLVEYRAFFGVDFTLKVIVRHHDSNNVMMRDVNYIDVLYLHSDTEIVQFMTGHDSPMAFWLATVLEQSDYVRYMFETLKFPSSLDTQSFVDALGYYQTLSLICPQVYRGTITSSTFDVPIPMLFDNKAQTVPHVFIAGVKVPDELVVYTVDVDNELITITLDASVAFTVGQALVVELQEDDTHFTYTFTPYPGAQTIDLPSSEFTVFKEYYSYPARVKRVNKWSSYSYEDVTGTGLYTITPLETGVRLNFLSHTVGNTYVIQGNKGLYKFTEISNADAFGSAIKIDLMTADNVGNPKPLLGQFAPIVYLNNKCLVEDVDFHLVEATLLAGTVSFYQIVIQNLEYIQELDNKIEVYIRKGVNVVLEHGHVTPGDPTGLLELFLWFPSLSMAYSNGQVISQGALRLGLFTAADVPSTYGALSGARTSVTYHSNTILNQADRAEDDEKITALRAYLKAWLTPAEPPIIVVQKSHRLYSIYMSHIVDYLVETYYALGPTDAFDYSGVARYVKRKYAYLQPFDLAYIGDLDRRFIDVYPAYHRRQIANRSVYKLIQRLAQGITEAPDPITDGDLLQ